MTEPDLIQREAREIVAALPVEKIAGQTVLLTGATGIVGTYFLATLRELVDGPHAPERVFAVARREVPAHLRALFTHPRFTLLTGELHDAAFCRARLVRVRPGPTSIRIGDNGSARHANAAA